LYSRAAYDGVRTVVIYEKVAPICLVINEDVKFTTIAFLQVALCTVYPHTAFLVHNQWIFTKTKLAWSVQYNFELDQI
jgi:hypothetical protein